MLTPQEAETHVFPKASFGGYSMTQVDAFLDTLIEDYGTLYKENVELKSKMKILVDKIEEYRATEDAMRMTLHSAQKMADNMVKEAEAKKNAALEEAVGEIRAKSEEARVQMGKEEQAIREHIEAVHLELANEEARLTAARSSTTAYVSRLKELYTHELEYIGNLHKLNVATPAPESAAPESQPASAPTQEEQKEEVAQDIEASMAKIFDEPVEAAAATADPPAEKTEDGNLGDTRVFQQIQPGKDYEIK